MSYFEKVKSIVEELGYNPENESPEEELFMITDEDSAINSLIIDCEDPVLIFEMLIMPYSDKMDAVRLLQMNRDMVHGAFVVDAEKEHIIWRDTLQLENLDSNELLGSINALSLAMSENNQELINMSKGEN